MPIRAARYSHNDNWLLSSDDAGLVKYWKPNLELVKVLIFPLVALLASEILTQDRALALSI